MAKVSIITVCYNNLEGLKRTYESVRSQTSRNEIEWIIIDGASTDGTPDWLKAHTAEIDKWVSEPDSGIFNAMNKGIRLATGEYCLFMNSGDPLSSSDVIEKCLPYLDGADLIYGDQKVYDPKNGKSDYWHAKYPMRPVDLMDSTLPHQATFIRTALHKTKLYREDIGIMGDYIFFCELIICNNSTTRKLPYSAGIFYLDGVSMKDWTGMMCKRELMFKHCFSEKLYNDLKSLESIEGLPFIGLNKRLQRYRKNWGSIKRKLLN